MVEIPPQYRNFTLKYSDMYNIEVPKHDNELPTIKIF